MGSSLTKNADDTGAAAAENPLVVDTENPYVKKILEARKQLTGWERVQLIFKTDEFGGITPEVQRIIHAAMLSFVIGGIMGGVGRGRIAQMNFLRSNAHEAFHTPLEAKRKLQDTVTLGMFAGAWRIGWRLTAFTTVYMSTATLVSTYRGKMGIVDQVSGAGLAGFVYKFPQGPKACLSGTIFGSAIGLGAGVITLGITKLTGDTIDSANLRYYQHLAKKEEKGVASVQENREILHKYDKQVLGTGGEDKGLYEDLTRFHDSLIAAIDRDEKISVNSNSQTTNTSQAQTQVDKSKSNTVAVHMSGSDDKM